MAVTLPAGVSKDSIRAVYEAITRTPDYGGNSPTYYSEGAAYGAPGYATPQDLLTLSNPVGSGKIMRITSWTMRMSSTSGTFSTLYWIRRSTLNSGGTSSTPTIYKANSTRGTPVGVVRLYTVLPTLGTADATFTTQFTTTVVTTAAPALVSLFTPLPTGATTTANEFPSLNPGELWAANWNGAAIPAGFAFGWYMSWTEDTLVT